jgi:hypothetical protein
VVARVTRTGGFLVHYSAPSRFIGERLRVHVYGDCITAWLGSTSVVRHPPCRPARARMAYCIDYHHVIQVLRRKPARLVASHLPQQPGWDACADPATGGLSITSLAAPSAASNQNLQVAQV